MPTNQVLVIDLTDCAAVPREELEKVLYAFSLVAALDKAKGKKRAAARLLDIHPSNVTRGIRRVPELLRCPLCAAEQSPQEAAHDPE
jgi:hypothetical protein